MQTLEDGFNWQLPKGALKVWWDVLSEENFSDEDFKKGCVQAIRNFKRFPSLNELIEVITEIRQNRLEVEWRRQKWEENKYRNLSQKDIIAKGVMESQSPKTKARLAATYKFLLGVIDKATWQELLKEIDDERE